MQRDYFLRFNIAGFSYYEGAIAFKKLQIGKKLNLKPEPKNVHDKHAVEIYFKTLKLGYIPRQDSRKIALLLKYGFDKFQARIQCINPEAHPEAQIEVILYLVEKKAV
ncbi:hypothetical protein PK35_15530 [Tamlana nanhaiensis]|uniref:HIRAN domain-containing protein n=1 Tax=Neotamlana nanhaiensis TaxID=1382798 RepID=A0A0D7VWL1_9FLAO|nr:HIRAN domain-containing protein [Tamlana nanhaiensis]KJD31245.1 hypothetical protein PK35_15530 [Tamlana nanhaiensis]